MGTRSGTFSKGRSGNPAGRPPGSRDRRTLALDSLLDGQAEALTNKAVELALAGDTVALRICMERIVPARKELPIVVDLPAIEKSDDTPRAAASILAAVAAGRLTISQGESLSRMVESVAGALSTAELAERVARLEAAAQQRG